MEKLPRAGYRVMAAREGKLTSVDKHQKPVMDLSRLKREQAETRMERDFLKNARRISRRGRGEVRPD